MALNLIFSFLIALLSGLGIGGGGLFTVYLVLASDMPQLAAQWLNLLFFLLSSGASVAIQLFRRKIMLGAVGIMVAAGIAGVFVGTWASAFIGGEYLRKMFGIMLVSGGIISLRRSLSQKYTNDLSTSSCKKGEKGNSNDTENEK